MSMQDLDPDSKRPWKTTTQACIIMSTGYAPADNSDLTRSSVQVFSECAQVQDTVGMMNSGIASAVAADMHKKQGGTRCIA